MPEAFLAGNVTPESVRKCEEEEESKESRSESAFFDGNQRRLQPAVLAIDRRDLNLAIAVAKSNSFLGLVPFTLL